MTGSVLGAIKMKTLMKQFLLLSIFLMICLFPVSSQSLFPKGTYMNCEELINRHPSSLDTFEIRKRSNGDIAMMGGNDFSVSSKSKKISKKKIKKEIFAVSTGDSLFLNCFPLGLQTKYTLAQLDGNFLIFNAGTPSDTNSDILLVSVAMGSLMGGVMGGVMRHAIGDAAPASKRYPYIMYLNGCRTAMLTRENFTYLLHPYTELYTRFMREKGKDSTEVLIRYYKEYVNLINQ